MLTAHGVRDIRVRRRLRVLMGSCALLLLVPLPADAQDICKLSGPDLQKEVEAGTAEIAEAYAKPSGQLALNGSPRLQRACNWTCSNPANLGFLRHVFAFLQYNCNTTTVPGTRLPTGFGTVSQMGLSITDARYREETDKIFRSGSTGVGDLMRVPPSLEDAAKSGDVKKLTDAVDALPGAGWLKFSSTSVDNGDPDGAARVIIRVPDTKKPPRFEQWIQIAIEKGTDKLGRNVDFLAVQLRSDRTSSEELTPPVVVFRGFSRKNTGFELEGPGSASQLSKCYSCHPSGVRTVVPAPEGSPAADKRAAIKPVGTIPLSGPGNITEITNEDAKKLTVFGPRGYTASENGPLFGPATGLDREAFVANGLPARSGRAAVRACAAGLPKLRQKAIVTNMNCEQCHDGSTDRGFLNAGTNLGTIKHKVVENTVAPMPPPAVWAQDPSLKLSQAERNVLFECLRAEYAELLHIWLTPNP